MEVNSSSSANDNSSVTVAESLWKFIHSPLTAIFSDLKNVAAEQMLRSLLESILKRASNLKNVLIPYQNTNSQNEGLKQQYNAFTTWLFGIMFYIVGAPLSTEVLTSSIDVQACMLRILAAHHIEAFVKISTEYMIILEEILEFYETTEDEEEITLSKFNTDRNIIENLDLTPFPVIIQSNNIASVQKSVLQIIIKSGVSAWDQKRLWHIVIQTLIKLPPDVKLVALKVSMQMVDICIIKDQETNKLVAHTIEIVKTIPTWLNLGQLTGNMMNEYIEVLLQIIKITMVSSITTKLCFEIIELLIYKVTSQYIKADEVKLHGKKVCQKIKQYLSIEPRSCTLSEAKRYITYFQKCPDFISIFVQFVYIEIKAAASMNQITNATQISIPWQLLRQTLNNAINKEKFDESLHILQATSLLQRWLTKQNIKVNLYEDDLNMILKVFIQKLDSVSCTSQNIIFENLIYMIVHDECNRALIQQLLLLPFTQNVSCATDISEKVINLAKSLDNEIMTKCFEAICQYGKEEKILQLIQGCILNNEIDLAVIGIENSAQLLNNPKTKLEDILKHILQPALSSTNERIQEALAVALGQIYCFLSGGIKIVSESSKNTNPLSECKYCVESIKNSEENMYLGTCFVQKKYDHLLKPYFQILSSNFSIVRSSMSNNFISFLTHSESFSSNEMAKLWLPYIKDAHSAVRSNVAVVIGQTLNIRINMLKKKGVTMLDEIPKDLDEFVDLIFDVMLETFVEALKTSNYSLHSTLLIATKDIARVSLHVIERRVLNVLLITIIHPNSSPTAVASATIAYQDIASFLGVSPKMLYIRYKTDFLMLMMQQTVCNYIEYSYNMATSLHRVAKCIGYEGSRELLRRDGHFALCHLLSFIIDVPKAVNLLRDIAELMYMDEKQMLIEHFSHICSYVFLNMTTRNGTECLKLVSKFSKTSLAVLTKDSFVGIFENLMLHFHESPEKVIGFLEIISEYDSSTKPNFSTKERTVSYLKLRLHGILVKFDVNLGPKSDEYTQKCALASLATLMRYMGSQHLTPLRYKILVTLRSLIGYHRPGFGPLICDAWDAFIHNISVDDLGPLLSTICVSLIPLLKIYPEKLNGMLQFLIQNKEFSNYISDLFFIDDMQVSKHLSSIVKAHILQAQPRGFCANLMLWLKRITHETDEVRMRALIYLKRFLADHRIDLNEMILSDTNVHPLIVELLDTLLVGCQDKDDNIRLLYGECLGELGALEPSLLPRRIISREDSKFIFDMKEEFACALLYENVRAFQMQKNTQSMDCFSLAMQEILKTYDIKPGGQNNELWNAIPQTMQQIFVPFLTSHYKITSTTDDNVFPHPIYGSEAGSSVESWTYNWLCSITNNLQNATLSKVLYACRPAFKRDMKIMTFALPYVVSYIITTGNEDVHNKLAEEMLTVINVRIQPTLDHELLKHRPLRHKYSVKADDTRISDEARRTRCSQIVFNILDHLQRWLRERRLHRDVQYEAMQKFCEKLDTLVIAEGCYQSQEYYRALMYLEQHMALSGKGLSETSESGLLAKIYAQLDEPDGVSGILATQDQSPTLQQLVLAHEVSGQLQDAATCYERLAQKETLKPSYLQGMIQCYLGLDHPFTAKNITEGVLSNRPELEPLMVEHEPFWRLAHFTRLDDTSQKDIKNILLEDLKKGVKPDFSGMKKNLVSLLEVASRPGGYQQTYSCIMKLHILNEFDKAVSLMLTDTEQVPTIFNEWEKRGELVRASREVEFVLGMRRATLDLAVKLQKETKGTENLTLKREIGKTWLKSAKIARKARLHQQAYMYILSASDSCPPQELYIEQAQLYWQKGCQEDAFTTLKRSFSNCFQPANYYKQIPSEQYTEERKQCAKAKLLFAKYNDETLNVDTDINICNYKEAIEVWRAWEKSLLACAQYYESVVDRMNDEERDTKGRDLQIHMMNYYGKSLQFGCKYIHQSMPRMLTIWLDFASRVASRPIQQAQKNEVQENDRLRVDCLLKMTKIMEVYHERLPIFMWLTAFSQLVSRICHRSSEVQKTLCNILVNLISAYPQHCLWMMASVINSSYPMRQRRCQEILNHPKLKTPEISRLIKDFNKLWERLIELSNKRVPEGMMNTTVSQLSKNIQRLFGNADFSLIMIPTSRFRQLHLPSRGASLENHNPFPTEWVHIAGIEDKVVIMPSLQRPRRIELRGSDGKKYLFMCKPTDDLRRDFRLMEFNDIVNKYLQKDPESRQRRLYIRTYSVVPLNEECGLIEWVPNLVGFRPILMNLYKERGIALTSRELKPLLCALKDPLEKKKQVFVEKLLPRHPPVLGDWFRLTFPDPYGWYEARAAYIRTTAVMSMVGYILGLGDRHGENILFDSKCGDCVHVDFNCLFNRGELFDWPERVPFRLTHNMVDAMGPLKIEGPFRRACQVTMRVLRQQSSTLLSVLTPFVYDPLVSWNRNLPGDAGEKTNEKAVEHIKNIEQRLKGLIRSQGKKLENIALNLSVEGQTNHLILEAMNIDNLCQMYFGWGAYM